MANVIFVRTTKEKQVNRQTYNEQALYFCTDSAELYRAGQLLTDGVRVVAKYDDLPAFEVAADGKLYFVEETKNGYVLNASRDGWIHVIYAPATDIDSIPDGEEHNVVVTVGAVRDIENAIYEYVDKEIANIEVSGGQGADGKTPYIQDGYWYIDGASTGVKAEGVDGKDGVDGADGKDGTPGKDGESAYEIWLGNGHSGSEDDFLQWLKGDNDPFGDVVTSVNCGGITAGTSLKGKTVKDVLTMLLGIKEAPKSAVEYIMDGNVPLYNGLDGEGFSEVAYKELDTNTASYTDQGFYTTTNANGEITNAGYQAVLDGNTNGIAQTFAVYSGARIITAYQYQPALNQWLNMGFDGTYWVETGTDTKIIDGQEVTYTTYAYNTELMGDAITATEYWRFEVEVL